MKKEIMISFKIIKLKQENGKVLYGLEIPTEYGSENIKSLSIYSNLETLVDGIYDYFDYDLYFFES